MTGDGALQPFAESPIKALAAHRVASYPASPSKWACIRTPK
jgi:hypothetical protein